jgi:hypothetical protein
VDVHLRERSAYFCNALLRVEVVLILGTVIVKFDLNLTHQLVHFRISCHRCYPAVHEVLYTYIYREAPSPEGILNLPRRVCLQCFLFSSSSNIVILNAFIF